MKVKAILVTIYILIMLPVSGWDIYLTSLEKKFEHTDYRDYSFRFKMGEGYWPKNNLSSWMATCQRQFVYPYDEKLRVETIPKDAWPEICKYAERKNIAPVEITNSIEKIGCESEELKYKTCNQANLIKQLATDLPEIRKKEQNYKEVFEKLSKQSVVHVTTATMWILFVFILAFLVLTRTRKKSDEIAPNPLVEVGLGIIGEALMEEIRKKEEEERRERERSYREKTIADLEHDIKVADLTKKKVILEKEIEDKTKKPPEPEDPKQKEEREINEQVSKFRHEMNKGRSLDDEHDRQVGQVYRLYGNDKDRLEKELSRLKAVYNRIKFKM